MMKTASDDLLRRLRVPQMPRERLQKMLDNLWWPRALWLLATTLGLTLWLSGGEALAALGMMVLAFVSSTLGSVGGAVLVTVLLGRLLRLTRLAHWVQQPPRGLSWPWVGASVVALLLVLQLLAEHTVAGRALEAALGGRMPIAQGVVVAAVLAMAWPWQDATKGLWPAAVMMQQKGLQALPVVAGALGLAGTWLLPLLVLLVAHAVYQSRAEAWDRAFQWSSWHGHRSSRAERWTMAWQVALGVLLLGPLLPLMAWVRGVGHRMPLAALGLGAALTVPQWGGASLPAWLALPLALPCMLLMLVAQVGATWLARRVVARGVQA
jgi:hypothetical protein